MEVLSNAQLNTVSGGSSLPKPQTLKLKEVLPQDMYGDTMSIEAWMDWTAQEHDPANGDSIHDFPGGRGK